MKDYIIYYKGYNDETLEITTFYQLESALSDCYYWLHNPSTINILSHIRIYKLASDCEISCSTCTACICEIHR